MSGWALVTRAVHLRNGCGGVEAAIRKEISGYARSDWGGSGFQVSSVVDGRRDCARAWGEFLRQAAPGRKGRSGSSDREGQADGGGGVCRGRSEGGFRFAGRG